MYSVGDDQLSICVSLDFESAGREENLLKCQHDPSVSAVNDQQSIAAV